MILLLAHNRRHCNFFTQLSKKFYGNYKTATSFPSLSAVDFDFFKMVGDNDYRDVNIEEIDIIFNKYEININKFAAFDRSISYYPTLLKKASMSRDDLRLYIFTLVKIFENLLDKEPIDTIFSELIIGLFDAVLHAVSLKKGVQYIGIRQSKMKEGFVLVNPYTEEPVAFNPKLDISNMDSKEYIQKESENHCSPNYMRHSKGNAKIFDLRLIQYLSLLFSTLSNPIVRNYYINRIQYRWHRFLNIYRTRKTNVQSLFSTELPKEINYYIYPLQFEPEATVMVRGYPFSDQIGLIERISRQLPEGKFLVVKEHLGNEGYRKIEDYFRLYSMPNVILVGRNFSVDYLLNRSEGVITISGRMGFEALCRGIKVCCLGYPFWRDATKFKYSNPESLSNLINKFDKSELEINESSLNSLVSVYLGSIYPGSFLMLDGNVCHTSNLSNFHTALSNWRSNEI